jgi:hypothetical protein
VAALRPGDSFRAISAAVANQIPEWLAASDRLLKTRSRLDVGADAIAPYTARSRPSTC